MKTLLVAMSRPDTVYGTHPARYAVVSGRKVLTRGVGAVDEVQGQAGSSLRLSLDSPANFTEPLRLRALSRRFVPILVQRHLSDTGVFTERFRARSCMEWLRQGEAEVHVQAMLEEDAELAQELLPTQERPLTHLVTPEAAVAALIGAATQQAVLVHWWHAGALRSLGVRAGRVAWHRVQPLGTLSTEASVANWRSLLQTATSSAPSEFDGPNGQSIRLGDGPWAASQDWAGQGARDLVSRLSELFKDVPADVVLKDPDLYGLAFARFEDSLVVNGYRQSVLAWRWAPTFAGIAGVAGAVLVATGLWWHMQAERDRSALQLEQAALAVQAQALRKQLPPAEAVTALHSAAWRETALGANLRTDRFLAELMAQMPQGVQITSLRMQRNGAAAERVRLVDGQPVQAGGSGKNANKRPQVARNTTPSDRLQLQPAALAPGFTEGAPARRMPVAGEPSFQVDLDILLSGGYAVAKLKGEQLAEKLSLLGRLSDTRLTFEDSAPATPGARLRTRLIIAAGAF